MNTLRRITKDILKKCCHRRYISLKQQSSKAQKVFSSVCTRKCLQIAVASTLIPQGKLNVEDDLRKAVEEGETAILDLMNQLQDLVITASREYRDCLRKQIELLKIASSAGQEAWDELPKFRTIANELNNELSAYLILLKTIGEMAYDQTLISLMIDKNSLQNVLKKYNELEVALQNEFDQNKLMEKELLDVSIANVLSGSKPK